MLFSRFWNWCCDRVNCFSLNFMYGILAVSLISEDMSLFMSINVKFEIIHMELVD